MIIIMRLVSKVSEIPCDYYGIMEIFLFLDKYNPRTIWEIIGLDRYTVPKSSLLVESGD